MCKPVFREYAKEITEEIIIEAKEKGYTIEDLAELIGVSKHSITHYLYDEKVPSLPAFIGLFRKTKPEKALKKLATWLSYAVFKLPKIDQQTAHPVILTKKTSVSLKEFSEFLDKTGDAIADNKITKQEAELIEKEGLEAIEKILEIIHIAKELSR